MPNYIHNNITFQPKNENSLYYALTLNYRFNGKSFHENFFKSNLYLQIIGKLGNKSLLASRWLA